jgi:predicted DNA-binding transcriptional regulator YafY
MTKRVEIDYTNWKGERRTRIVRPIHGGMQHSHNQYHPKSQWLFQAVDEETGKVKTFAMAGLHSWKTIE